MKKVLWLFVLSFLLFSCGEDSSVMIKMENVGGVYVIPAKVNGLPLNFIFDTGASEVSISLTEAIFMAKNGYLEENDIKGTSFAQLADGSVTENTRIRIKKIEIGELAIHDVSAAIIHNADAPLLLGQSAIKKLGRIEFDGDNLIIHTSGKQTKDNGLKVDEKSQIPLDSLICLAYKELKSSDCMLAQKHIHNARQLSISANITNRNWEIDCIDASIKGKLAPSVSDAWKAEMPLLKSAFYANTELKDGTCVKFDKLLKCYALGLAEHYSPDDGTSLDKNDRTYEDEFINVISLLIEKDKYTAYVFSARYYEKNFNIAKSYCEKAIAIDSTKSDGYRQLGIIYCYTAGDNEQAIKCYEKALEMSDADSGYIHRLFAWCYPDHSSECKSHLRQAAQLGDIEAQNKLKEMGVTW